MVAAAKAVMAKGLDWCRQAASKGFTKLSPYSEELGKKSQTHMASPTLLSCSAQLLSPAHHSLPGQTALELAE